MIVEEIEVLKILLTVSLVIGFTTSAAAVQIPDDIFEMGRFKGQKLEDAINSANQYPLGSEKNPVRVNMPQGQRAYLSRLRCSDKAMPRFARRGSVGVGPFGSITDVYEVDCGQVWPGKVSVYLDMYHPEHKEVRAVPGFVIEP
ncbi:MAG: hypothetical protein JHD10_04425 [Sphingomonadaceae bacterium]|nr:hypothetical protein [Sphingomonadaceae bacterium]